MNNRKDLFESRMLSIDQKIAAEDAFLLACSFRDVARLCAGKYPSGDIVTRKYIIPEIVNIAFSCEVFIKSMLICEKAKYGKNHKLHELFKLLSLSVQDEVVTGVTQKLGIEAGSFDELLKQNGSCFYEWRYYYELDVTPANIGFLRALCDSFHPIAEKYVYGTN